MNLLRKYDNFYDEFRTLVLNVEYYSERVESTRRLVRFMDVFLALFATGTGITGLALWKTEVLGEFGPAALTILGSIALMLSLVRPYLKLEDELERLSALHGTYVAAANVMRDVIERIQTREAIDEISESTYYVVRQIRFSMGPREDAPPKRRLSRRIQAIVDKKHPVSSFYYPPDQEDIINTPTAERGAA